ncbi:MAG TPA: HAD-IA family hydrolase [Candidatus Saccharimonadales bacterium]|jgi:putative hydrolase of the HAD superfamily
MIKAIIFDCFGVLVKDAFQSLVIESGLSEEDQNKLWALSNAASKGSISHEVYKESVSEILGITVEEYVNRIKVGEVKNKQLLEYIAEIKPDYKIGMLSNVSSMDSLTSRFTDDELAVFDVVVASSQIGYAKPEAQSYEITVDKLGVLLNECLMIDDRELYCQGARGVGMSSILYTSFEQMKVELEATLQI